jgi:hypothetical protein
MLLQCVCVIALLTQHAKCMRRVTLSSVASLAPPYFTTLYPKRHDFRKKLLNTKYVFRFCLQVLSEKLFILRRI